jgi:ketosteroid isomerase-like protein
MAVSQDIQVDEAVLGISMRWASAERDGDTTLLATLLTDDFVGVGPRGFTLSKQGWLDRYSSGALRHDTFSWDDVQVRVYGDAAIAVGMTASNGTFSGQPISGRSRLTQVLVRANGSWVIAGIHMSPAPAFAPVPE